MTTVKNMQNSHKRISKQQLFHL